MLYEMTIGNLLLSEEMNFDIIIIMTASRITSYVRIPAMSLERQY
jgi:hypothetical protein